VADPGGVYAGPVEAACVHAFATTLCSRRCRAVVDPPLALHHDAATDVTVVHLLGPAAGAAVVPAAVHEALVRCAAEELGDELTVSGRAPH
jgi:hypothetical protein